MRAWQAFTEPLRQLGVPHPDHVNFITSDIHGMTVGTVCDLLCGDESCPGWEDGIIITTLDDWHADVDLGPDPGTPIYDQLVLEQEARRYAGFRQRWVVGIDPATVDWSGDGMSFKAGALVNSKSVLTFEITEPVDADVLRLYFGEDVQTGDFASDTAEAIANLQRWYDEPGRD